MRRLSLNARNAHLQEHSAEVEVALFCFEHPDLDAPIRLSTDPTERLSSDPLMYGTRSEWLDADPETDPYYFVVASAELPSDLDDATSTASVVLENVSRDIAGLLLSFTSLASVHVAVVLASSPDVVEAEFRDLKLVSAVVDAGEVSLQLSRAPIEEETIPMDRFTKDRFPGLFR